ncbi:MAG: hypothetical protein H0W84_09225 [Bacteroidetes bacterium]|nr:hypothetical protein [Bacteroidota bacterium]
MKAFKLININSTDSSFQEGTITELIPIKAKYFQIETKTAIESLWHPAPRYQFAITVKGKLKFTVTNGDTFIVEPGVIVIANDLLGKGHKWEIVDGNEWHRIYIVPDPNADECFKLLMV